ncbi:MCE family protein [Flavobacteriaceae bacterium R38]|nr:MCE family protein [Flavobacteriaceae bacterium R38]
MKLSRELKTAILVLAGILLFIIGFNYLKSNSLLGTEKKYYAVYDHVGGLLTGTPVTINGFTVGTVKDIRFLDDNGESAKLIVIFTINNDFPFSKNSTAELYDTGIIGGKGIQILPVFDNAVSAKSGDTLNSSIRPGITELVTNKLTPLQEQLGTVLVDADSLLTSVNSILDKDTRDDIKNSLEGLSTTITNFKKASASIDELIEGNQIKLDSTLNNVENITGNFSKISDTLIAANLGKTVKDLQFTIGNINSLLTKIDNGEGSVGKLLKDEKLYDDLTGASAQLELLLQDMRLNPKRYVHFSLFGRKQKVYQTPKEENTENN